ncbi:hypothetical protein GCM10023225_08860 [Kineococcus glutinatus]|uniref:Uncharacterized protein n=2 Tax=Kineococcus glutinatus TaxID=1070872 RepID=A0ABP9HE30_9ACTN
MTPPTDGTQPGEAIVEPALSAVPADVAIARSLLVSLADEASDSATVLVASCALAQLDDVWPPYPPAEPALATSAGRVLHDEAVAALQLLVGSALDAGQRARALLALQELTTPIWFTTPAGLR